MAAIPYLWYWIMGGLVAVFIATVAIFSERSVTVFVENQSVSSEEEGSSEPVKDESVIDQKSDPVSETGEASEKIEDDVKSQEAEVITEKSTDKAASEEKVIITLLNLKRSELMMMERLLSQVWLIQDLY